MKKFVEVFLCTHLALSQKIKSSVPNDAHDERTAVGTDAVSPDSARKLQKAVAHDVLGIRTVAHNAAGKRKHPPAKAGIDPVQRLCIARPERPQKQFNFFAVGRRHAFPPCKVLLIVTHPASFVKREKSAPLWKK